MSWISRILKNKEKITIPAIGILFNVIFLNYLYDYLFYPYIIWRFGLFKGAIVMIPLSTFICYLLLLFYDWSKKDWLGIESIKQIKEKEMHTWIGRVTSWILKRSDLLALLFLSIQFDPFITTVYLRRGSHQFNGMTARDWRIFFGSAAIANFYWTFIIFTGISIIEYVIRWLSI